MNNDNNTSKAKQRKVLFIDVPGVLNKTKINQYGYAEFGNEEMSRLVRILNETQCEVCVNPQLAQGKERGYSLRVIEGEVNLLKAIFPAFPIRVYDEPGLALAEFADTERPVYSFAVVRCFDRPDLAWELTFPTRYVKICHEGGNGLADEDVKRILGLLNTPVDAGDIPLKVITKDDVIKTAKQFFSNISRDGLYFVKEPTSKLENV